MQDINLSIFRGQNRSDGTERWHLEYGLPGGAKRRRTFDSRDAAERQRHLIRLRYAEAGDLPTYCLSELLEIYVEERILRGLKPSTSADYKQRIKYYIDPHLGGREVSGLTRGQLQLWVDMLEDNGLAANTIRNTFQLVSGALRWALSRNLIDRNPSDGVELPIGPSRPREVIWSAAEASSALRSSGPERLKVFMHLALHLALRKGEILGLRWEEVDLDKRQIRISGTVYSVYTPGKNAGTSQLSLSTPKSEASNRVLPFSGQLASLLASWRSKQIREAKAAGVLAPPWVIASTNGNPVSPSNLSRQFRRFCQTNQLTPVTIHSLRKSSLVMALQGGASIEEASQFAGHTSINLTKHVYAKFVPGFNQGAARAIYRTIGAAQ